MTGTVDYDMAVISLCPDLVDPQVQGIPVAAFAVGKLEKRGVATLIMPAKVDVSGSPVLEELVWALPDLLREVIDDILNSSVGANTEQIILLLEETFQNTLHVSNVQRGQTAEVAVGDQHPRDALSEFLQKEAMRLYRRDVMDAAMRNPNIQVDRTPQSRSWPLRGAGVEATPAMV